MPTPKKLSQLTELPQLQQLMLAQPNATLQQIDLPYRLSSLTLEQLRNSAVWYDESEQIIGWVLFQWPFWMIDIAVHPDHEASLFPEMVAWLDAHARSIAGSEAGKPTWFVTVEKHHTARLNALEAVGFASQEEVEGNPWYQVLMAHVSGEALAEGVIPAGITIRPLAGPTEVAAYVAAHRAAFESESMTLAWRQATLQQPAYRPSSDLVALNEDGEIIGFCIGWLTRVGSDQKWVGHIEPMGVIPAYQSHGIGKPLLTATMKALYQLGADSILVYTENYRESAIGFYKAIGFRFKRRVLILRKDYVE